jgi:hypothetical protein
MTEIALQGIELLESSEPARGPSRARALTARLTRPFRGLREVPHVDTWAGVLLTAGGAVLLVIAWGKTAGLSYVPLQIPYVVSAGFTGLGLVAVGLTVVSISAKRADARIRTEQLAELRDLLAELRRAVEEDRS